MARSPFLTVFNTLECRPDNYQGWYQQANALSDQGRYPEALMSYERALHYYPQDYWSWYKRGVILENLGQHEAAIASYDNALKIDPQNYWAWYDQGYVYLEGLKKYEEAIT